MKKQILFIIVMIIFFSNIYATNYNCSSNLELTNFSNENTININDGCSLISFKYKNINNEKVVFDLIYNKTENKYPISIYDNSNESDYENQINQPYEFYLENFEDNEFKMKYSSKILLETSNYINRNKFIGTQNTNGYIQIENTIGSGEKYFISSSFSNFDELDLNFENFGSGNNEFSEYRVFVSDINILSIYSDNSNEESNEKILLIEDNINEINYNNNIDNNNKNYRINTISYNEFMANNIDKTYMSNRISNTSINNNTNSNEIIDSEEKLFENTNVDNVIKDKSLPFASWVFGLLVVFISTLIVRENEKMFVRTKRNMFFNLSIAIFFSILILYFTNNILIALITSITFNTIYAIVYYINYMSVEKMKRLLIQNTIIILFIILSYSIYIYLI